MSSRTKETLSFRVSMLSVCYSEQMTTFMVFFCKTKQLESLQYHRGTCLLSSNPKYAEYLRHPSRSNTHREAPRAPPNTPTAGIKWPPSRASGERKTKMNGVLFSAAVPHRPPTRLLCLPRSVPVSVCLSGVLSVPCYKPHQLQQKPVVMENNER